MSAAPLQQLTPTAARAACNRFAAQTAKFAVEHPKRAAAASRGESEHEDRDESKHEDRDENKHEDRLIQRWNASYSRLRARPSPQTQQP